MPLGDSYMYCILLQLDKAFYKIMSERHAFCVMYYYVFRSGQFEISSKTFYPLYNCKNKLLINNPRFHNLHIWMFYYMCTQECNSNFCLAWYSSGKRFYLGSLHGYIYKIGKGNNPTSNPWELSLKIPSQAQSFYSFDFLFSKLLLLIKPISNVWLF